jgi:hypothetical protein
LPGVHRNSRVPETDRLAATYGLAGYVGSFLASALTCLVCVAILVADMRQGGPVEPARAPEGASSGADIVGGYQLVVRDRAFGTAKDWLLGRACWALPTAVLWLRRWKRKRASGENEPVKVGNAKLLAVRG